MPYDTRQRQQRPAPNVDAHPSTTTLTTSTTPTATTTLSRDVLPPFPPSHVKLHPDDAQNKVLIAIARVLLAVNNCAMTIKDLAETCLVLGLLCHNVSAATQAITHWIRNHHRRCELEGDAPLVLKHVLSGTRADDDVAPALHSLSGGASGSGLTADHTKPAVAANTTGGVDRAQQSSGAGPGNGPRETHFRRGTVVWYLSPAAGAPCPFARAGIIPQPSDSVTLSRKRKRPSVSHEPGPTPQRPKLLLRLPPLALARKQLNNSHSGSRSRSGSVIDDDDDDDVDDGSVSDAASNSSVMQIDTPFSPFPPSASISIPLYIPDPDVGHRSRFLDDTYDSDAPPPPDSEDEDDDYHNSMMRPPSFDLDISTSPATTAEPCTPAIKQELSPPVAIVKAEAEYESSAVLLERWGVPTLEAKHEESVIRILPSDWVSPPDVIDLVSEPWRFPSVSTDASEDFDLDVAVKEEELIAKLEPTEDGSLSYRSSVSCEQDGSGGDDEKWQPGAIPDDIVEEVSRRLALTSCSYSDLPLESVAAEDFDGAWCADQDPGGPARPVIRRATVSCLPPAPSRPTCRPTRAASMSSIPRRVILRTCTPFCPAIMATFVDGIPVYQTFLDTHRLLRRMDSDFVNVLPLMRFLQIRVNIRQEPRCVVVRNGRDGVPGIWAPLEFARRLALSQPSSPAPRLPKDTLSVFLRDGLEAHFPPPLPEVRDGTMDWFGDPFGEDGEVLHVVDIKEDDALVAALPTLRELEDLALVDLSPLPDSSPVLAPSVPLGDVTGAVDMMTAFDPMLVEDAKVAATEEPSVSATPRRTLRKTSQLAKLAIASIAERDQEDSSSSDDDDDEDGEEDEESDLTEPEPEFELAHIKAACVVAAPEPEPVKPPPAKTGPKTNAKAKAKATKSKTPLTPTNATASTPGPRTRRQTEEAAATQRTLRRSTRNASGSDNVSAVALAVGATRKRGAQAKAK